MLSGGANFWSLWLYITRTNISPAAHRDGVEDAPILDGDNRAVPLDGLSADGGERRLEEAALEETARRASAHGKVDAGHGRDVARRLAESWAPASAARGMHSELNNIRRCAHGCRATYSYLDVLSPMMTNDVVRSLEGAADAPNA